MNGPDADMAECVRDAARDRRLRILTWHVHGNYLYSLGHLPHDIYVPVSDCAGPGYGRLGARIPWSANLREIPLRDLGRHDFDCILYQARSHWEAADALLTEAQRRLPCIYLEHNPPEPHAAESRHFFTHPRGLLLHVTAYNALMWDSGGMPWRIVEHGVPAPAVGPRDGTLARGIVAVNHMHRRGRRLGADLFECARRRAAIDLIGMESEQYGGLGEVPNMEVAAFMARYRYFFSPVRYGSLSLALVEAMMTGLPVVGVASTELPNVVTSGVHGYVDTRWPRVLEAARMLQADAGLAREWGRAARRMALRRFGIRRFVDDWNRVLSEVMEDCNA